LQLIASLIMLAYDDEEEQKIDWEIAHDSSSDFTQAWMAFLAQNPVIRQAARLTFAQGEPWRVPAFRQRRMNGFIMVSSDTRFESGRTRRGRKTE